MSQIHLRLPGFTYSACGPLQNKRTEYKNLKKQIYLLKRTAILAKIFQANCSFTVK